MPLSSKGPGRRRSKKVISWTWGFTAATMYSKPIGGKIANPKDPAWLSLI